jgi:phage terminase large subunit GpA-like protein
VRWAEDNIVFDNDNRFPGPYKADRFPFFKKILHALEPDHPASIVVLMGSAQTGKTITAEVFMGAILTLIGGSVFYVTATIDMAGLWFLEKWNAFVTGTKALARIMPVTKSSRDRANRATYKQSLDGKSSIRAAGANSAKSLSSMTYRYQVHDEMGKWDDNEHGDPEDQADMRSQSWGPWAKIFKISTPGVKGICRIAKNYERSNQQEYHLRCPHCSFKQALEWDNFKHSLYEGMEYSEAHFTCVKCGEKIEHHHKEGMLQASISDPDAWVANNPKSDIEGFYIWLAYSPLQDWAYIARRYFKALGDPRAEQTFMNEVVGLPYEQKGDAPPWEELHKRAVENEEGYPQGIIPPGAILLTIGMDVQGDRVDWLLKGWGSNLRRWTIQHGVIQGHISEQSTRDAMDILAKREWKNIFGRSFRADMIAIDANWETNSVKDWAKRFPESCVITVKGAREYTAVPIRLVKEERRKDGKIKNRQKRHWLIGVSGMKAALYKLLEKEDPLARGYCGFAVDLETDYFKQLCSEKRVLETNKKTGHSTMKWVRLPDVRNEILDMENYAEAAARRLGWHEWDDKMWEAMRAEREKPLPDQQLDLLEPTAFVKPSLPASDTAGSPPNVKGGKTSISDRLA